MTALKPKNAPRILFTILLALLFVTATTAGSLWHHHSSSVAESTCPICHLGHQAAEQPVVIKAAPVLSAVGPQLPLADPVVEFAPSVSRLASRAPPSL